jgi:hypothetical protein
MEALEPLLPEKCRRNQPSTNSDEPVAIYNDTTTKSGLAVNMSASNVIGQSWNTVEGLRVAMPSSHWQHSDARRIRIA